MGMLYRSGVFHHAECKEVREAEVIGRRGCMDAGEAEALDLGLEECGAHGKLERTLHRQCPL